MGTIGFGWTRTEVDSLEVTTSQDVPGFVSNALLMPFINEAIMCLEKVARNPRFEVDADGFPQGVATRDDIDKTFRLGMAHPMGPLQLGEQACVSHLSVDC